MEAIRRRGYRFVRGLLDAERVWRLAAQVTAICGKHGWREGRRGFAYDAPEFYQLQAEVQTLAAFSDLRDDPRVLRTVGRLLGGPAHSGQGDVCRVLFPHAPEFTTKPHQDQFFLKRARDVWGAWIPLGDCPQEQGSLAVAPGSRRWGLLPHDEREGAAVPKGTRWRKFDFRAGDVLFLHSLTLHKALPNLSERLRISMDCRYSL